MLRRSDGYACCGPLCRNGIDEFGWCAGLFSVKCALGLTNPRVVAHSVGTASMSLAGVLGCSGCTSGSKSGSISGLSWALVFLSCWNRLRVGVSVAVSVLVTLLVRFGGDELGSGLRVCSQSCRW